MNQSKRLILSLSAFLGLSTAPHALWAAGKGDNPHNIATFVDPEKIAIDPILLKTEDLNRVDLSQFAPSAGTESSEKPQPIETSPVEELYSKRLREPIYQFGYDSFPQTPAPASGAAVQESYILEAGDEVNILIRGGRSINLSTTIGEDGMLIVEDLPPVNASGKSVKAVREELISLVSDIYNTELFLSVTKTRQLSINIAGNVRHPGQVTLSTFNTVIDALGAAGGIKKAGTLRQIKLIRDNRTTIIDLYGILIYGSGTTDISLRDGDRIIVPPIGPTLAVAGSAKRAAIYEILPASSSLWKEHGGISQQLSLDDVLDLSGGAILPSKTRYLRLNLENKNADEVSDVTNTYERIFGDGDILLISQSEQTGRERRSGNIELSGTTPQAGLYALAEAPSLSYLLKDDSALTPDTYPLIGLIQRWNAGQLSQELIAFSPLQIILHKADLPLKESDNIILLSRDDILGLKTPESNDNLPDGTEGLSKETSSPLGNDIKNFLIEHAVFLRGSIRASGAYPVANETTLDDLLAVAGGASLEANIRNIEITQPRADKTTQRTQINLSSTPAALITLHPGDTIRVGQNFRRIEDRHVLLTGEVKNPGTYDLIAGDTLGSLIKRAGGLSEQSYPEGAIFSRKSERAREEQRYKSQARSLELSLATAMQEKEDNRKPNAQEIAMARDLITELKGAEALGRITVEADPGMLEANPDLDILLESGDRIYVPKRPLTVRVAGETLSPASLQFRTGKSPRDYINEAGGFSYNADQDRAFVVMPDGSAQPLSVSAWNYKATMIPPGATIIVPRDPKPLTFMDGAKDLSQILANLATTAIFAEDLQDGN